MASMFKKHLILQVVAYVVATLLLWAGLSFAPSYADEAEVTYYAFVTHKLDGESAWKTAYQFPILHPGIYRFQIVMFPKSLEGKSPNWYALRGEIEFETDPGGGVKVKKRHTLEDQEETSGLWAIAETAQNAPQNNWAAIRQEKLQPIIEQMTKLRSSGSPDPNLMRFLVLNQKVKDTSWQSYDGSKNYRLFRLHYLEADDLNNKYKNALSRFLNPGEEPTTDIEQLQEWVDEQDSFKSAGYLGEADDKHKDFYGAFKTWFNQLNLSQLDEGNGEESSSWVWLFLAVLFVVIVAVIGREVWLPAEKPPYRLDYEDDDETEEGTKKPGFINQLIKQTAATIGNRTTKPSNYVSKNELKSLRNELANSNNVQPLEKRLTKLEKEFSSVNHHIKQQLEMMNKKLIELEKNPAPSNRGGNQVSSASMMYSYVSKAEFADAVEKVIRQKLLAQTEKLQNISKSESVENIVRQQLNLYFGTDQFQRTVADQLEFSTKTNPYLKDKTPAPARPKKALQAPPETKPTVNTAAEPIQESRPPNATTNDVIDKIKTVLLSMKSVEEAALDTLDANVDPCTFVTNVVANCLKLNQSATHYQRLDRSIQEITGGKVSLIIPNVGEDIRQEEHNAMSTQTATKGELNTIASLLRPGVKCDNDIRHRAEVIQTI